MDCCSTRRFLLAVMVICLLAVTFMFPRLLRLPPPHPPPPQTQSFTTKEAGGISSPCPAGAVTELTENVYNDNDLPVRRLPQFLIIGVQKAGTRALLEFLNLHPDVRAPAHEINFFQLNYKRGLEWYRQQMPASHAGQFSVFLRFLQNITNKVVVFRCSFITACLLIKIRQ